MQWKARIDHPFGWWLGQIREVSHNWVMVEFVQYPDTSLWRRLEIPFSTRKPSVAISSGCILGWGAVTYPTKPSCQSTWLAPNVNLSDI